MSPGSAPIRLKDLTSDELGAALAHLGVKPALARKLQAAAVRRDEWLSDGPGISAAVLRRVRDNAELPRLALVGKVVSPVDGFARYVFRGDGPELFEAVRIPLLHRPEDPKYVVCVSSQAGCALGCAFCVTGKGGFKRHLATWEIVDQAVRIRADSPHPIGGVVFMGMGEPLLNYDAVVRAARILSEPCGMAISGKAITISTAGVVPGIRRFTADRLPFRLVVSLTSADPRRRRELMPIEATWPTADLLDAIREYHAVSRQRVPLAWIMISGVNTTREEARALAELTRGLPIKLDLIDVNDPEGRFRPPSDDELNRFRDALREEVGMPVARRYSGGRDIQAACGLLAGNSPVPGAKGSTDVV